MRKLLMLVPVVLPLVPVGCGSTAGNTSVACSALGTPTKAAPTKDWGGTVFTIVMENHSQGDIVGSSSAPFLNQLISQNALAGGYHDSYVHPSEPNYLWMVAGENFGILNDNDPGASNHVDSKSHLADQIENAGLTWKSYQENMTQPCGLASGGRYAAKHNPFVYFDDINGWDGTKVNPTQRCQDHVVDYSQLDADLASGKLPSYAFITPNLDNDMHDGSVQQGDQWLSREVPKILASDAFNKGGVLFIVWDEGSLQSDDPPLIAISPNAKRGFVSKTAYDTSSFLKTVESVLGIESLPCVQNASTVQAMDDLFTCPLGDGSAATTGAGTPATGTPPAGTPPAGTPATGRAPTGSGSGTPTTAAAGTAPSAAATR